MANRRANGEGNVYQRPNGQWEARLSYLDPVTGKRKRVSTYGPNRKAALKKLDEARDRIEQGKPVKDANMTVGAWIAHWRATTLVASNRAETTKEQYANLARVHLEPAPFGAKTLNKLKPSDIDELIARMREKTKPSKKEGETPRRALSDSTIRTVYTILRLALSEDEGAVRDGLLARNPAAQVKRPRVEPTEAKYLPAADVIALLKAAEGSRYHLALVLAATTGMRSGEVLALHWDNVDLEAGIAKVVATISRVGGTLKIRAPKTARSRRQVPLAPPVIEMLKKHRIEQMKEKLEAGSQWTQTGLVITTEFGTPVDPRNLLRVVESARKKLEDRGDGVVTHSLRHSAAVAMLEGGVHIKAVADIMGHSSIAITGDLYGHSADPVARSAINGLAGQFGL